METNYRKQAEDFLVKTKTEFKARFLSHGKYFENDKVSRDIYEITLNRNGKIYTFNFGQSVANSGVPKDTVDAFAYHKIDYYKYEARHGYVAAQKKAKELRNGTPPTAYDVLACLTKHDIGTHKDFCSDYGYDEDSRKGLETYLKVQEEYRNIYRLFHDVMEELQEIN